MQIYLVGGAVRDQLLGRPVHERDWVVVGATPAQMEQQGFRAVGRDFPVYLHPVTHEEYALARLEKKTAPGYRGFVTAFSPDVTLEQDLQRRDLTINAIAQSEDGALTDPYGGRRDLEQRWLRHVSPAFVEDPVRVLRIARFAARFAGLGFRIAPETQALLERMVRDGETRALVSERVWRETERALSEDTPQAFFDCLAGCGALTDILPELHWDQAARTALERATASGREPVTRFAALLADTPEAAIGALSERLRVPNDFRELALLSARLQTRLAAAGQLDATGLLEVLERADAVRRPERFERLLQAVEARTGASMERPRRALALIASIALPPEQLAALRGPAIAAALRAARLDRLTTLANQ